MGQVDPVLFAADTVVRLLTVGAIEVIPWACVGLALCYLHARWSRKG